MTDKRLEELRAAIDRLDGQLLRLLNDRAELAQAVGQVKQGNQPNPAPSAGKTVFWRPEREARQLRRLLGENEGPLPAAAVQRIFAEIISASLALEQPHRLGLLSADGVAGACAALGRFGGSATLHWFADVQALHGALRDGRIDTLLVPHWRGRAVLDPRWLLPDITLRAEVAAAPMQGLPGASAEGAPDGSIGVGYFALGLAAKAKTPPSGDDLAVWLLLGDGVALEQLPDLEEVAGKSGVTGLLRYRLATPAGSPVGAALVLVADGHREQEAVARLAGELQGVVKAASGLQLHTLGSCPRLAVVP